jgi:hypothetical protein
MFARLMTAELRPGDEQKFATMVRDQIIPRVQNLPGFKGGYWLADHENGRAIGITLFENEAALDATEEQANRIREEVSRNAGLPVPSFQRCEVIGSLVVPEKEKAAA